VQRSPRNEFAPRYLVSRKESRDSRQLGLAIACAYALRDFTGKDFGLDVAKWDAFVKEQPELFK